MAEEQKDVTVDQSRAPVAARPRLHDELERFFGNRWPRFGWPAFSSPLGSSLGSSLPEGSTNVDVVDKEEEVVVRAELPGFDKDNVDVSVTDRNLTIKATSESEEKEEDGDYYRREISRGYVYRTVSLPAEVLGEEATAKLKDGVLEVSVPKVAKAKRQSVKIEAD